MTAFVAADAPFAFPRWGIWRDICRDFRKVFCCNLAGFQNDNFGLVNIVERNRPPQWISFS